MRFLPALFCFLATAAQAKDCEAPRYEARKVAGLVAFADCMNDRVGKLEAENAKLRDELEKTRVALSGFPGELKNDNGRVTRSGGDNLLQASFSTSARKGQAAAGLAIDQQALEAMCAVGCTVHLALTAEALRNTDPPPVFADATCTLRYTAKNGAWAQGGGCGDAVTGVDGDGKPPGEAGGEVLATAGGACLLTDAEPGRGVNDDGQVLGADRAKGLFLVAAPLMFTGADARFRCELKLGR
jgi:hypothetical protein